jgi:ABC-type amino acid transport system permease subunit
MAANNFSWSRMALVLALTLLVGIGEYAVAYQFNDGKITQKVIGAVFLGMALPSLLIGGVMRVFRPNLQRYFAISAGICVMIGLLLIFVKP